MNGGRGSRSRDCGRMAGMAAFLFISVHILPAEAATANPAEPTMAGLVRGLIAAPDSPVLHFELGSMYFKQGIFPQAEKEFLIAINLTKAARAGGAHGGGPAEIDLRKAYYRAARAQRSLTPDIAEIQALRRSLPADQEVAMWLVEILLDKGDGAAAKNIIAGFPNLRKNADILSQWLKSGEGGKAESYTALEEQLNDYATLMEIGSDAHKTTAAQSILSVSARLPRSTASAARLKTMDGAFDWLKSRTAPPVHYALYRQYMNVLNAWQITARLKPFVVEMRKKFPEARADAALSYLLARLEADDGRTDDAIHLIQDAMGLGLDDGSARMLLGGLLQKKGRDADAAMSYVTALEGLMAEHDRRAVVSRLENWIARLDPSNPPAGPDALFEKLAVQLPNSAVAQALLAVRFERAGERDRAFERYQSAWTRDGRIKSAREGMARMAIALNRTTDLARVLPSMTADEVRHLWNLSPSAILGRRLMAMGDTEPVRRLARSIESAARPPAEQLTLAAELAIAEGRLSDATAVYMRLKRARPLQEDEVRSLSAARERMSRARAESYFAEGQYRAALESFNTLADSQTPVLVVRRAACMAKLNRPNEALLLLERATMTGPHQIQRVALMAGLYEQTGRPMQAEQVYRELLRSDSAPMAMAAAKKLAGLLAARERWADALPILDRIVEQPGLTAAEKMVWIRGKLRTRNLEEADRIGRMLREIVSDTTDAYALLGEYEHLVGNRDAARTAFLLALRRSPNNAEAAMGMATLMRETGESEQAIRLLNGIEPKTRELCRLLAQVHADRGEWQMAAAWMEKSATSAEEKSQTAWYWFRAGQYDEASHYAEKGGLFEAILEAESGRFDRLQDGHGELLKSVIGEMDMVADASTVSRWRGEMLSMARLRMDAGDYEAALAICADLLSRGDNPEAGYLKGVSLLRLGLYDDARDALIGAAKSSDWAMPANLRLGQLELIRDRPEEALAYLDKSGPAADPAELIMAWGMALAMSKSPDQGEQILKHLAQKSARGKFFLGKLLERQDKYKDALAQYKAALKDDELFHAARFSLGELALKTGDPAMAELSFKTILERGGGSPYAGPAMRRLDGIRHATLDISP